MTSSLFCRWTSYLAMRPVRILLVDDSPEFLDAVARLIAAYAELEIVGVARSGEQAIELVEVLAPDLILMDVAMPGMNGIETTRCIKSRPQAPCVIVVSFHDSVEYRAFARSAGAADLIGKNTFVQALLPAIARHFPLSDSSAAVCASFS
jgi:DNA-binding NarL/FixJ family response regulator